MKESTENRINAFFQLIGGLILLAAGLALALPALILFGLLS